VTAGERSIPAPLPGKILAVNVVPGDAVTEGAVLLILEAMKMENDILAPAGGTVKAVKVQNGDTVKTGDLLVVIE
jgi:glutaconyl-CoA decarboxylase